MARQKASQILRFKSTTPVKEPLKMEILLLLVSSVTTLILVYWWRRRHLLKLAARIPGPPALPLLGNALQFASEDFSEYFHTLLGYVATYGSTVRIWFGPALVIAITDPKHIERIVANDKMYSRGTWIRKIAHKTFKDGILLSDGKKWKKRRKILGTAFQHNILMKFENKFSKYSLNLCKKLEKMADGNFYDVYILFTQCALDMVCDTALGYELNAVANNDTALINHLQSILEYFVTKMTKPWLMFDWVERLLKINTKYFAAVEYMESIVMDVITKRRYFYDEKIAAGEDIDIENLDETFLLDVLLQNKELSTENIIGEITSLAGAGGETTSTASSFVLALLCEHQEIQDKVIQEQRDIFADDFLRPVTTTDLPLMLYLEQVIKETLRLYPPLIFHFREIMEDLDIGNGYIIPAGSVTFTIPYVTQRNPDYYTDPEKFDPDRFLPENFVGLHPYAYIPFGLGRRSCVGHNYAMMELKTLLSTVLRRFRFLSVKGGMKKMEETLKFGLTLKPGCGFKLSFVPRCEEN